MKLQGRQIFEVLCTCPLHLFVALSNNCDLVILDDDNQDLA